jgi:molecular chaperone DnaK (HSP70)
MSKPFAWLEGWDAELIHNEPIRVVGIDLGTTVSTVTEVFWTPGSGEEPVATVKEIPQSIHNAPDKITDLVPSVVALVNGQEFVGTGAQILRGTQSVGLRIGTDLWAETKNVIGTRKTYPNAPEGYQTPKDIAARILKFLIEAVKLDDPSNIDRVVITVPASFQSTQRKDTIEAAKEAGIDIQSGDLMDEPVAAFLDFMVQHPEFAASLQGFQRFMVVDFGGGTCDVALLQVRRDPQGGALKIFRKGVSRFHRIGGADIDQVIVHKILIPQIIEQNNIDPRDLNYDIKKRVIEPVLMGTAEILKKKLSDIITQRIKLGTFVENDPVLVVNLPNTIKIETK